MGEGAAAATTPRPRGTLARCLFAWVAGGLACASVLVLAAGWGAGALSARTDGLALGVLEVAWSAYLGGWNGVIVTTPFAAVAAVVAGGRQGRNAAIGGLAWVALVTLQSVAGMIAGAAPMPGWADAVYSAAALLLMGVVPLSIGVSAVLAGAWRWRDSRTAADDLPCEGDADAAGAVR